MAPSRGQAFQPADRQVKDAEIALISGHVTFDDVTPDATVPKFVPA